MEAQIKALTEASILWAERPSNHTDNFQGYFWSCLGWSDEHYEEAMGWLDSYDEMTSGFCEEEYQEMREVLISSGTFTEIEVSKMLNLSVLLEYRKFLEDMPDI